MDCQNVRIIDDTSDRLIVRPNPGPENPRAGRLSGPPRIPVEVTMNVLLRLPRSVLPFWFLAAGLAPASPGEPAAPPKTHTLFMGADLEVEIKGDFCRVRDVSGDAFIVNDHGKDRSVSMMGAPVSLQVQQSLKLTTASATIANLTGERSYTSANDPVKRFMREQPGSAAQTTVGMADGNALVMSNLAAAGTSVSTQGGRYEGGGIGNAGALAKQTQAYAATAGMADFAEANNIGAYVGRMQAERDKELFDAMEVTFEVSSEKPLTDPYVVIIARYREKDAPPGKARNWIFAKALAPIDRKPHRIRIREGGFPPGFVMEDYKVHLYDRGEELATNVADKRVELTRDEAFQYLVLEHIANHKGADAPATPVMGRLPPDLPARLRNGEFTQTCYVKVSKDGLPGDAFNDASCGRKIDDPYLRAVIQELRFKPALRQGQPVEAVARLNLNDLPL
jgi:hypothetical protein